MPHAMKSTDLVRTALNFEPPPYPPLFDQYWGAFLNAWRARHRLPPRTDIALDDLVYDDDAIQTYYRVDLYKLIPNEDPWPSLKKELGREGPYIIQRDAWGRILRRAPTSPYGQAISVPLEGKSDPDSLQFEPADADKRYAAMLAEMAHAQQLPHRPYLFIKIGGPYLRCSFLRGDSQWLMDIAEDPSFAAALAERMTDHLIAVGLEALRRTDLYRHSIWIFDDIASNQGVLMSPKSYERIFLPQTRRMVTAFQLAGAARVGMHSDGDLREVLDGLVDAGISILNPIEPRASMDVVELRRRYGKQLAFVGGVCNTEVLPWGTDADVRAHVEHVLSIAGEGGLVIGSHSIGPDVSLERYELFMDILHAHGRPRPGEGDRRTGGGGTGRSRGTDGPQHDGRMRLPAASSSTNRRRPWQVGPFSQEQWGFRADRMPGTSLTGWCDLGSFRASQDRQPRCPVVTSSTPAPTRQLY